MFQTKYQREVDRLEKENRDLRKQLNLLETSTGKKRKMNVRLVLTVRVGVVLLS